MSKELRLGKMTSKEIAEWLGITYNTYKKNVKKHLEKLDGFCDFEQIRGGINVKEIYISIYDKNLSKKVECMIIIGGRNSSNTKKLYEIAKKYCINTVLVETAKELQNYKMEKCSKIGVMAGASTPQKSIQDVVDGLNSYYQIMN